MSREIKFRAWDKKEKKMAQVDAMDWGADNNIVTAHLSFLEGELRKKVYPNKRLGDDVDFMQYTGLKDKNGKEIYEEDIVKIGNDGIAQVSFIDGCWQTYEEDRIELCASLYGWISPLEVIGNIYENPELTKS